MGHQIIRQPDGRLCVFSTVVDEIVIADATPEELADFYAAEAAERAREEVKRITDAALAGDTRKIYHQFVMSYAEAVKEHKRRGGDPAMIREVPHVDA